MPHANQMFASLKENCEHKGIEVVFESYGWLFPFLGHSLAFLLPSLCLPTVLALTLSCLWLSLTSNLTMGFPTEVAFEFNNHPLQLRSSKIHN